jgi:hypothetical protein
LQQGKTMKQSRKEPVFLLEMPHPLRHIIMKRGHLLRGDRTRTLCCMSKGGSKAWLEAKLIPSPGESAEENWDNAHGLAAKFKRQLHSDVYIEPTGDNGRFKEMTSPPLPPEFDHAEDFPSPTRSNDSEWGASMGPVVPSGMPSILSQPL